MIICEQCEHYYVCADKQANNGCLGKCPNFKKEQYERPQGDLISRQDAIDALEEQLDYLQMLNKNENPTAEGKWYGVNWARNTIADLPYKQNKRPKESELVKAYLQGFNTGVEIVKNARLQGEWLFVSRNCWKCPYCQELTNEGKNFCPNCGAYMRGENNG